MCVCVYKDMFNTKLKFFNKNQWALMWNYDINFLWNKKNNVSSKTQSNVNQICKQESEVEYLGSYLTFWLILRKKSGKNKQRVMSSRHCTNNRNN